MRMYKLIYIYQHQELTTQFVDCMDESLRPAEKTIKTPHRRFISMSKENVVNRKMQFGHPNRCTLIAGYFNDKVKCSL